MPKRQITAGSDGIPLAKVYIHLILLITTLE
jgi:hypothetical protein